MLGGDSSQTRLGWESDLNFFPRVQCLALGLAEGTELYRPLRESHKVGGLQPKKKGRLDLDDSLTILPHSSSRSLVSAS